MAQRPHSHLRLVPSVDETLDREIAELPNFTVPESTELDSIMPYAELVIANCNYVLEHGEAMTDEQCYTILKKFDKQFLKVKKTDEGIFVLDPRNLNHHNQSVKKRLVDICTSIRNRFYEYLKNNGIDPKGDPTKR